MNISKNRLKYFTNNKRWSYLQRTIRKGISAFNAFNAKETRELIALYNVFLYTWESNRRKLNSSVKSKKQFKPWSHHSLQNTTRGCTFVHHCYLVSTWSLAISNASFNIWIAIANFWVNCHNCFFFHIKISKNQIRPLKTLFTKWWQMPSITLKDVLWFSNIESRQRGSA